MLSFSHENQLERCPQVSVRRVFCYSRRELVFFLAWHERSFSFLRIFSNDTGILVLSRLYTFRPVSDLLVFRVLQKMIWRKSATSRRFNKIGGNVSEPLDRARGAHRDLSASGGLGRCAEIDFCVS
jgi:hypothetical protein